MKKFLLATVGLLALGIAAPAAAADLGARPYTKAPPPPPPPPVYDWNGFYIGANGGWGQSRNCLNFVTVGGVFISDGCREGSGALAGGQLGYRWQTGGWVFGLEGQGDWADLSNIRISLIDPTVSTRARVNGIGLLTGQVGWAWNASLLYLKGGGAVTGNRFDILTTLGGNTLATVNSTRWGGTLGVGWEYGFAPNWSAGVEYDHLWIGNSNNSNSFVVVTPNVVGSFNRTSQDVDMVTVRVNYRFGGPGGPGVVPY